MKLWQWVLVLALLVVGVATVVAMERRYDTLRMEAEAKADTLAMVRVQVDEMTALAVQRAGEVAILRNRVAQDSARWAAERVRLRSRLVASQREGERMEVALRSRLDSVGAAMLDSLVAAHQATTAALTADVVVLENELEGERSLRMLTEQALAETTTALEACRCALDVADETVAAFQAAADSRTFLGRAWDAVTSKRGLVVVGAAAVAWLTYEALSDDGGSVVVVQEKDHHGHYATVGVPAFRR